MSGGDATAQRVLLTGGQGFVGRRLQAAIQRRGDWTVVAPGGPHDTGSAILDVTNEAQVAELVGDLQPTVIVHLAAISAVTTAIREPRTAWAVNLGGTSNVAQAIAHKAPDCHLLFVSSAEVYGRSLQSASPVTEAALLQPVNPYAASKAAADILVRQQAFAGMSATVARPFNHTGAGQAETFVAPAFAAQIARIEEGRQPPVLHVGDLDDERDFLDVEDVVDAYIALLETRAERASGSVFNVASGRALRIGDILEMLLGHSQTSIEVRVDASRLRTGGVRSVTGDAAALKSATGWAPSRKIGDTLNELLDESRRTLRRQSARD